MGINIESLKAQVSIEQVIGQWVELKKLGPNYKSTCPFHQDDTPSFNVNPATGHWHCFGACGEGGDVIDFVMKIAGLDLPAAAREVAAIAGVALTDDGKPQEPKEVITAEQRRLAKHWAIGTQWYCERRLEALVDTFETVDISNCTKTITKLRRLIGRERELIAAYEKHLTANPKLARACIAESMAWGNAMFALMDRYWAQAGPIESVSGAAA